MRALYLTALAACAALPLLSLRGAPAAGFAADHAGSYDIDAVHSTVLFRIKHMGVSYFYGRMNEFAGNVKLAEDPAECSVKAVIQAGSVDSANSGRDDHIKGPDFLNAVQFPEITFTSKKVSKVSDELYKVIADFDFHGVTREIEVDMTFVGARDTGQRGYRAGFEGRFTINRRDFGMETYPDDVLSNEIDLILGIETLRN